MVEEVGVDVHNVTDPAATPVNRLIARPFIVFFPPTEKKEHPTRACRKVCSDKAEHLRKQQNLPVQGRMRKETAY
jgi:hypothetical protein